MKMSGDDEDDTKKLLSNSDEINTSNTLPNRVLTVSDIAITVAVPNSIFEIGFNSTKEGDIYFNDMIAKQWPDKKWQSFYNNKLPYNLDWTDKPILSASQKIHEYRYYLLSPPSLKNYRIDNNFFENNIIRKILKIQDDARLKRKKLNALLKKNPYRGLFKTYSDYFILYDEYDGDNWTATSEFKKAESESIRELLFFLKVFVVYVIILPIVCLLCIILEFLIGFYEQTATAENKDIEYFNFMASNNPDLDQIRIEEVIVQDLVALATELNVQLAPLGLTVNVFAGDVSTVLKGTATEQEYRRFLLLFQEINV